MLYLTPLDANNRTIYGAELPIPLEYLIPEPPDGIMPMAITPALRATL